MSSKKDTNKEKRSKSKKTQIIRKSYSTEQDYRSKRLSGQVSGSRSRSTRSSSEDYECARKRRRQDEKNRIVKHNKFITGTDISGFSESEDNRFGRICNKFKTNINQTESDIDKTKEGIYKTEREITYTKRKINKTRREVDNTARRINKTNRGFEKEETTETTQIIKETITYDRPNVNNIIDTVVDDDNKNQNIVIKRFTDYRPKKDNTQYFSKPNNDPEENGLAVVVPFFNEPSHELQQTLNSLHETWSYLKKISKKWRDKRMNVLIIQDGWHHAHDSMKQYLKKLFPKKIGGKNWWEYYKCFNDYNQDRDGTITFIFERKDYESVNINTQKSLENNPKFLRLSLMIKINNRRKHNSHEWFLGKNGFGETINSKYLFLTDAFTLFNDTCLYHLVKQLDKEKNLSAITGRQRVMTREQQGSHESIFSFANMLRLVQGFDFEMANAVYNGAFSLGGFLPVIPGPCGLYRASDVLQDNVRNSYFKVVNSEPDETGSIKGNLKIAEDRILTFFGVIKTKDQKSMAFNPLALFYFEAELQLMKLILQRRRWINGSVAGYIYLLFTGSRHMRQWKIAFYRKLYIWFLLFCQFLIYGLVSISPSITIRVCYYGILYFLGVFNIAPTIELVITAVALWAIYLIHVVVHHKYRFIYIIMYILVLVSFFTSIVSFGSLIHYELFNTGSPLLTTIINGNVTLYLGSFVFIGPFIIALLLSGRGHSTLLMIKAFIPYLLFMPMMISWFGSYSYSRTWDLSWGNRPSNELNDITAEQRKNMVKDFKEKSRLLILGILVLNVIVFFLPLDGIIIIMNIFFVLASIQMLFSLIFVLIKIFYKIRFSIKRCRVCCRNRRKRKRNIDYSNIA